MQNRILQLCGRESTVIQNGINISAISEVVNNLKERKNIVSIRAIHPLYRIDEIFKARVHTIEKPCINFIYPYWEDNYKAKIVKNFIPDDKDLGRISRDKMYELLSSAKLVISIPESDSSPRSVYEAIFCGCCVVVTYNPWIDALPDCMKSRLFIVDLNDILWLQKALDHADLIVKQPYAPSEIALNLFDQRKSMQIIANSFY